MADHKKRDMISPTGGFFSGISDHLKLVIRLMGDRRVRPFLKLIPIGTIAYLVIPDLVLGPLDDALIIWLGTVLFVELCPPEVVEEHMTALQRTNEQLQNTVTTLTATNTFQGGSVRVDRTGYDEAAQGDVAGYNVYSKTSSISSVSTLTPVLTVPAGTVSAIVDGLVNNTTYYFLPVVTWGDS